MSNRHYRKEETAFEFVEVGALRQAQTLGQSHIAIDFEDFYACSVNKSLYLLDSG